MQIPDRKYRETNFHEEWSQIVDNIFAPVFVTSLVIALCLLYHASLGGV
jgi:hypothetical protein